jgi:aralkylamine N-acetyltransferase
MTICDDERIRTVIIDKPTADEILMIIELYQLQGWWQADDENRNQLIPKLISGSHCFVVALAGDKIVGMGRAISDGISDAYIQDMTVRREYRNRGIGRGILQTILDKLQSGGLQWIGLIAEPGSSGLYKSAGFRQMSAWTPMLLNSKI